MQYSSISSCLNSKHPTGKMDMPFSKCEKAFLWSNQHFEYFCNNVFKAMHLCKRWTLALDSYIHFYFWVIRGMPSAKICFLLNWYDHRLLSSLSRTGNSLNRRAQCWHSQWFSLYILIDATQNPGILSHMMPNPVEVP